MSASDQAGGPGGLTRLATLTIDLLDLNDHAPEFDQTDYQWSVSEGAEPSSRIGRAFATDRDESPNNRIQYSIMSGGSGRFYIDRITGMTHYHS